MSCIEDPFRHVAYCKREFVRVINPPRPCHTHSFISSFKRDKDHSSQACRLSHKVKSTYFDGHSTIYSEDLASISTPFNQALKNRKEVQRSQEKRLISKKRKEDHNRVNSDIFWVNIPHMCDNKWCYLLQKDLRYHRHTRRSNQGRKSSWFSSQIAKGIAT